MIKPDVDILKNATSKRGKGERNDILTILYNIELGLFEGFSYHYSDKPSQAEESITDRTKLRRQKLNEIAKKEKEMSFDFFKKYFGYSSPSNMYKTLNETKNSDKNKAQVNTIENKLTNLVTAQK